MDSLSHLKHRGAFRLPTLQLTTANHSDRCLRFSYCSRYEWFMINRNVVKRVLLETLLVNNTVEIHFFIIQKYINNTKPKCNL